MIEVVIILLVIIIIGILLILHSIIAIEKILKSNLHILSMLEDDIYNKEDDPYVRLWNYLNMYGYLEKYEEYEILKDLAPKINNLFDKLKENDTDRSDQSIHK